MSLQLIYAWSKKIHNWMMWLMLLIGSGMTIGGLIMHRELEGEWYPSFIDIVLVRWLHNQMATPFAIVLGVMMLTGVVMWGVPKILIHRKSVNP